ncbi:thioredoxin domain-containing protein [Nesterenkonia sp. F]|uniref:thioredoxin domain-containing protein n=1 Tax=Nesterenkonia sp. F TaxID=795955 RepID=UPI000255D351|nr:DUF255 domain-containing protein [Nesterenkonia sp. F]
MGHRLAESSSRYLRQHADNPVDWHPWGEGAFAEARRRDVPVFVSIGYSACHWCHVMAAESFSDAQIAETLNDGFVAIKVDREEHPDVDDAYMAATQALTGQGGWPMSVFTDPSGRVFHAGTYFPPRRRGQIPSFAEVLDAVRAAWTRRRDEVEASAAQIAAALGDQRRRQAQLATAPAEELGAPHPEHDGVPGTGILAQAGDVVAQAIQALLAEEDTVHGGFSPAPKFPPSPLLGLLLEEAARDPESPAGPPAIRVMEAMGRSALHDQIEGGFARYATDRAWALPHFEKMLADNAQLLGHYARLSVHPAATEATRAEAERVGRGVVDWLHRRMLLDSGLLASSLDADTVDASGRHQEGGTYLMSDRDLRAAARAAGLGDDDAARLVALDRGVPADEAGTAAHVTEDTPRTVHFDAPLSGEDRRVWEAVLPVLRRRRAARAQPARDEKAVAAWNAMAVRSLAEAAVCWADEDLLERAGRLGERLWDVHVDDGTGDVGPGLAAGDADAGPVVRRVSHAGRADAALGTLTDHAQMISACFTLASVGAGDAQRWLDRGRRLLATLRRRFVVEDEEGRPALVESADGGAMLTAALQGPALATPFDGPEPGGVAAAADALQQAEALVATADGDGLPDEDALRAADILHHAPTAAPRAPMVVGSSLQVLRRVAVGSPAFRILSATAEDLAAVRRAAVLHGPAVEPPAEGAIGPGRPLRLSVCLNAVEAMVCLPPESTVAAALGRLGERPPG